MLVPKEGEGKKKKGAHGHLRRGQYRSVSGWVEL